MRQASQWSNKKVSGKFIGHHERDRKGERVFVLVGKERRITFESWQAAKTLGWMKK